MGNKRKHKSSVQSNSDLTKEEDFDNTSPVRVVKRSASVSGQRSVNPFSIVPDNYSDRNDSDDNSDDEAFDELRRIHQINGGSISRRLSAGQPTTSGASEFGESEYSSSTQNRQNNGFENEEESEVGQSSKKQKKKGKKKEKALQLYGEKEETTQLPSKDDVNEIIGHLKQASAKSWEVFLRVIQWIAVKFLALIVLIIQVVLLVLSFIWKVLSTIFYYIMRTIFSAFPFLNSILLKKHDQRDPFKRSLNNVNMMRIFNQESQLFNFKMKDGSKRKRFTLALDLDETLVYTQPYSMKKNEVVDVDSNPNMFKVIHPTQKQVQVFTFQKRPGLDMFLLEMSKIYNLVIYSSAQKQYVDAVIEKIDTNKLIERRFYRDHCIKCNGVYFKNLQNVGTMQQCVILDNSPEAVKLDSANSFVIASFRGQENDQELFLYTKVLQFIAEHSVKKNIDISDAIHYFQDNFM